MKWLNFLHLRTQKTIFWRKSLERLNIRLCLWRLTKLRPFCEVNCIKKIIFALNLGHFWLRVYESTFFRIRLLDKWRYNRLVLQMRSHRLELYACDQIFFQPVFDIHFSENFIKLFRIRNSILLQSKINILGRLFN